MSRKLIDLLYSDGVIQDQMYQEAVVESDSKRNAIAYILRKKYISETKLLYFLSRKFNLPTINLEKFEVAPEIIRLLTPAQVEKYSVIPIQKNQGTLVVAVYDPTNLNSIQDLNFQTRLNVEVVLTTISSFELARQRYFGGAGFVGEALAVLNQESKKAKREAQKTRRDNNDDDSMLAANLAGIHELDGKSVDATDAPVIALVNGLLRESVNKGASDIHVEPYETRFRARMRVDGALLDVASIPVELKRPIIARIKIMAKMDIGESRLPQDGRIKLKIRGSSVDIRVNSIPTVYGEKIVMRILNQSSLELDLNGLGFEARQFQVFRKGIESPNGMVLVTGPTGSGKTTTLYSALADLNKVSKNISTVEDPVEYNLDGINQIQVHSDIGLTFANVLRAILRQDPDIVLVGEIRDLETAEIAVQAALTGHLVLSTLHTNDAASAITRLHHMGIEPFLIVGSVNTIVAQRLVRKVCGHCRAPESVPKAQLVEIGFARDAVDKVIPMKGKGCLKCGNTGYLGRLAIYEVLDFSPTLKEMVLRGATAAEIKRQAIKEGMKTLRMSALTRVLEGQTSLEEALSITMEQ